MSSFSFSSVFSALKKAGLSGTTLTSAVQDIAASSPNTTITGICNQMLTNVSNPKVVADLLQRISETPNVPSAVVGVINAAPANPNPTQVAELVRDIETALGPSGAISL